MSMRNTILTAAALVLFSSAVMAQSTDTKSPPTTGPAAQSMPQDDFDTTKDKMSRATIMATDFSARRRYRRVVRYAPRYYRQRYIEERYYAEPVYSSPAYSSYGWHSGLHHDWHSGAYYHGHHDGEHHDWHGDNDD
jgi:hypothetical protein